MPHIQRNKISVYLIKNRYSEFSDVLKDENSLEQEALDGLGVFYYEKSEAHQPSWVTDFFEGSLRNVKKLYGAVASGLLLVKSQCDGNKSRIFALAWGSGRQFLLSGVCEERFGLYVTLNLVDEDSLRKIDKKNMSSVPKDTKEQLAKVGTAADFGIDIEQDLIRAISGISNDDAFGKSVEGKDVLTVKAPVNLRSLQRFLKKCYERYTSNDYKKNFGWVDQISDIRDEKLITTLNDQLLKNIKNGKLEKTWMAVPEIIDWTKIKGFGYSNQQDESNDDINLTDFLKPLSKKERRDLTIEYLEKELVYYLNEQDIVQEDWSAYNCLYCEITNGSNTYLLSNGKWYEIEKDFAKMVNGDFDKAVKASTITLPDCSEAKEPDYNKKIPESHSSYFSMDRDLINHGGPNGRIEFCDLITTDKKIIHVKRYGGSSVLSHLFSQGLVSGELFIRDSEFRKKLNAKLPAKLKLADSEVRPKPDDYTIVFAIISESKDSLEIPFFSKVSFRVAKLRLEAFGYPVFITKIQAN